MLDDIGDASKLLDNVSDAGKALDDIDVPGKVPDVDAPKAPDIDTPKAPDIDAPAKVPEVDGAKGLDDVETLKGVETESFLPDDYYNNQLPKQVSPGTNSLPKYDEFGNLKQVKFYDDFGREIGWIDYSDHGFPSNHTVPHWHEVQYSAQYPFGIEYSHRMDINPPF